MRGRVKIQLVLSHQFCYLFYVIWKSEQISFDQVNPTLDSNLTVSSRHTRTLNVQRLKSNHLFCTSREGANIIIFMAEEIIASLLSDDILFREFISYKAQSLKFDIS